MAYESEPRSKEVQLPAQRGVTLGGLSDVNPTLSGTIIEGEVKEVGPGAISNIYTESSLFARRTPGTGITTPPTEISGEPALVRTFSSRGLEPDLRFVDANERALSVLVVDLGDDRLSKNFIEDNVGNGNAVVDWSISMSSQGIMGRLTPSQRLDVIADLVPAEEGKKESVRLDAKAILDKVSTGLTTVDKETGVVQRPSLELVHEGVKDLLDTDNILKEAQSTKLRGQFSDELRNTGTMPVVHAINSVFNALTQDVPVSEPIWYNADPDQGVAQIRRYAVPVGSDPKLSEMALRALVPFLRTQTPEGIPEKLFLAGIDLKDLPADILDKIITVCADQNIKVIFADKTPIVGRGYTAAGRIERAADAKRFSEEVIGRTPEQVQTTGASASLHRSTGTSVDGGTNITYKATAAYAETVATSSSAHRTDNATFDEGVTEGYRSEERAPAGAMQELREYEIAVFDPRRQEIGVYNIFTGQFLRPLVPPQKITATRESLRADYERQLDAGQGQGQVTGAQGNNLAIGAHPERPPHRVVLLDPQDHNIRPVLEELVEAYNLYKDATKGPIMSFDRFMEEKKKRFGGAYPKYIPDALRRKYGIATTGEGGVLRKAGQWLGMVGEREIKIEVTKLEYTKALYTYWSQQAGMNDRDAFKAWYQNPDPKIQGEITAFRERYFITDL